MSKATLIKLKTDDGMIEVDDDIPLGKEYDVALGTRQMVTGFNIPKQIWWGEREMVWAHAEEPEWEGWFPTELSRFEGLH